MATVAPKHKGQVPDSLLFLILILVSNSFLLLLVRHLLLEAMHLLLVANIVSDGQVKDQSHETLQPCAYCF